MSLMPARNKDCPFWYESESEPSTTSKMQWMQSQLMVSHPVIREVYPCHYDTQNQPVCPEQQQTPRQNTYSCVSSCSELSFGNQQFKPQQQVVADPSAPNSCSVLTSQVASLPTGQSIPFLGTGNPVSTPLLSRSQHSIADQVGPSESVNAVAISSYGCPAGQSYNQGITIHPSQSLTPLKHYMQHQQQLLSLTEPISHEAVIMQSGDELTSVGYPFVDFCSVSTTAQIPSFAGDVPEINVDDCHSQYVAYNPDAMFTTSDTMRPQNNYSQSSFLAEEFSSNYYPDETVLHQHPNSTLAQMKVLGSLGMDMLTQSVMRQTEQQQPQTDLSLSHDISAYDSQLSHKYVACDTNFVEFTATTTQPSQIHIKSEIESDGGCTPKPSYVSQTTRGIGDDSDSNGDAFGGAACSGTQFSSLNFISFRDPFYQPNYRQQPVNQNAAATQARCQSADSSSTSGEQTSETVSGEKLKTLVVRNSCST